MPRSSPRVPRALAPLLALTVVPLLSTAAAHAAAAYNRQPDLHGDRIVFAAEGDLWLVPDTGGTARRLTSHPGTEYFPHFSPDGTQIAFTGEYDGNRDVFVVAAGGGEPRRLTFHPGGDEVIDWTPDGKSVIFRSRSEHPLASELFRVPAAGGEPVKVPIGWATRIDIDPQSGQYAFTRTSWESATWKRYRGGTAPSLWVGHPDRKDFRQVTTFPGLNAYPMWIDGRVYFLSDQGGTGNIWSIAPGGDDRRRHTDLDGWDVRWPSRSNDGRIVFTAGADIFVFSPATGGDGSVTKVDIDVPSDRMLVRARYPDAKKTITSIAISPEGDRLAVVSRGEIFALAAKDGPVLPVTRGSGARESWASFSNDGKRIVYVTDAPREEEIRSIDAWGRGEPKTIVAAGTSGWHFPPEWSGDGASVAWSDQNQTLWIAPAAGGTPVQVDRSTQAEIRDYSFSADGRFLAYAKTAPNDYSSIYIHDVRGKTTHRVTGPYTNDYAPAWDPDGRYLYFLSDRETNPVLDTRDMQNVEISNTRPYMLLLRRDVKNPFTPSGGLPEADDAADTKDGEKEPKDARAAKSGKAGAKADPSAAKKPDDEDHDEDDDRKGKKKLEPPKPVTIEFDGLEGRFVALPGVERGRYSRIGATADHVLLLEQPVSGMADEGNEGPGEGGGEATLHTYSLEKKKLHEFVDGVASFELAPRADKVAVVKSPGEIHVVEVGDHAPEAMEEAKVDLDGLVVELDPRAEWEQIYFEGWRHMRDFYWDPGMGGVDWKAVRDRYATLLPRLGTREDLRDLMGELIGELATSHTYVWGGDAAREVPRVSTGLLGATFERVPGGVRVARIYRGDPADNVRSPLQEPGVDVREGHVVVAVNHRPLPADRPFIAALEGLADRDVILSVKDNDGGATRDVVVRPLSDDQPLRYADWVRGNREYVAAKTGGKMGYIHLPNMGSQGQIAFNTWFYPQLDKEGLVVDERWNGGGFVSQMIVERLRRKVVSFDRARGGGVFTYPYRTLNGPFVVLINEFAGSDGDIFPAVVKLEKLAPVIGMRTWGGVVGIRGDKPMVDGGMLTQPEFAWWEPGRGWSLENEGVDPDLEVQNLPQDLARGVDAQLDRGIAEVLALHAKNPPVRPQFGPPRERSRKAYGKEVAPR